MKTTKKDFEIFKAEVRRFMDVFELNNWEVAFEHKELKNNNATITPQLGNYKAVITLSTDNDYDKVTSDYSFTEYIKRNALHEVIHLLLSRMSVVGQSRYISNAEQEEAEEELVIKLMHIFNKRDI